MQLQQPWMQPTKLLHGVKQENNRRNDSETLPVNTPYMSNAKGSGGHKYRTVPVLVRLQSFQALCENKKILHLKWLQWPLSVKKTGNEAEEADTT
jgi:hypothetical protein